LIAGFASVETVLASTEESKELSPLYVLARRAEVVAANLPGSVLISDDLEADLHT